MRKNAYFALAALAVIPLLGLSCEGWLTWSFEATQEIPVRQLPEGELVSADYNLDLLELKDTEEYQSQNFDIVKSAAVTALELRITDTSGTSDWSFLDSATMKLKAEGLDELTLATVQNPGAVTTLNFVVNSSNILPFLEADSADIDIDWSGTVPSGGVEFDGTVTYKVVVSLQK